jgi:chorismate-pyruvate lyase
MDVSPGGRAPRVTPELNVLIRQFHISLEDLGRFSEVSPEEMPAPARNLLWHDEHMTVALEAYHDSHVKVRVLESIRTERHYARHVLLSCGPHDKIVQYGIVRLNLAFLDDEVWKELETEEVPLGRVLIKHNVLRHVRLLSLWRVEPGPNLANLFGMAEPETCFGRTALIYCNEVPALEALEIVTAL